MMAMSATAFFSWFRFYVIHGSVQRDYETRVGQIIATTPLNRVLYAFGKTLSNFAILCTMTVILAVAGVLMGDFAARGRWRCGRWYRRFCSLRRCRHWQLHRRWRCCLRGWGGCGVGLGMWCVSCGSWGQCGWQGFLLAVLAGSGAGVRLLCVWAGESGGLAGRHAPGAFWLPPASDHW